MLPPEYVKQFIFGRIESYSRQAKFYIVKTSRSLPLLKGDLRGMFSLARLLSVVRYTIIPKRTSPLPPSKGGGCAMS